MGHDKPQYKIDHNWLDKRRNYLWLHCKNIEAAVECWAYHSFCHTGDSFVYTTTGKLWVHDLSLEINNNTIIPLITEQDISSLDNFSQCFGVCTDYPAFIK